MRAGNGNGSSTLDRNSHQHQHQHLLDSAGNTVGGGCNGGGCNGGGGSRASSSSTLDRAGLSSASTTPLRRGVDTNGMCKTEQLLERQKAQAVAVLTKESAFNLRCLWVGWVFMCWVAGMMTAAGFLLPYWLKGSRQASDVSKQLSDLGLFRLCAYPRQVDGQVRLVMDCGHYRHFVEIPSPLWKLAFVLMATACCLLLLLTFFLAFTGFRLFILRIRSVVAICGVAQAFSSLFVLLSCILYPAGWRDNPDVAQVCGLEADSFSLGHCHLGWAYVLTCAGGFLCAVTVAFPAQIARHFPEEPPPAPRPAASAVATAGPRPQLVGAHQQHHQQYHHGEPPALATGTGGYLHQSQQPLLQQASPHSVGGGGGSRYNYVVYHSMQQMQQMQPSRPPSVCTCATSDCHQRPASAAAGDSAEVGGNGGVDARYSDLPEEDGTAGAVV